VDRQPKPSSAWTTARWVDTAPLGRPVVPEVYRQRAAEREHVLPPVDAGGRALAEAHAQDGAAQLGGGVPGALDPLGVRDQDSDTEMAPIEVMAANEMTHSG
jgi:hypothetical protein